MIYREDIGGLVRWPGLSFGKVKCSSQSGYRLSRAPYNHPILAENTRYTTESSGPYLKGNVFTLLHSRLVVIRGTRGIEKRTVGLEIIIAGVDLGACETEAFVEQLEKSGSNERGRVFSLRDFHPVIIRSTRYCDCLRQKSHFHLRMMPFQSCRFPRNAT